jgi:hypothetical protein
MFFIRGSVSTNKWILSRIKQTYLKLEPLTLNDVYDLVFMSFDHEVKLITYDLYKMFTNWILNFPELINYLKNVIGGNFDTYLYGILRRISINNDVNFLEHLYTIFPFKIKSVIKTCFGKLVKPEFDKYSKYFNENIFKWIIKNVDFTEKNKILALFKLAAQANSVSGMRLMLQIYPKETFGIENVDHATMDYVKNWIIKRLT